MTTPTYTAADVDELITVIHEICVQSNQVRRLMADVDRHATEAGDITIGLTLIGVGREVSELVMSRANEEPTTVTDAIAELRAQQEIGARCLQILTQVFTAFGWDVP